MIRSYEHLCTCTGPSRYNKFLHRLVFFLKDSPFFRCAHVDARPYFNWLSFLLSGLWSLAELVTKFPQQCVYVRNIFQPLMALKSLCKQWIYFQQNLSKNYYAVLWHPESWFYWTPAQERFAGKAFPVPLHCLRQDRHVLLHLLFCSLQAALPTHLALVPDVWFPAIRCMSVHRVSPPPPSPQETSCSFLMKTYGRNTQ